MSLANKNQRRTFRPFGESQNSIDDIRHICYNIKHLYAMKRTLNTMINRSKNEKDGGCRPKE